MFNPAFTLSEEEICKIRVEIIDGEIVGRGKMRYCLYSDPPSMILDITPSLLDLPASAKPRLARFFGGGAFSDEIVAEVGRGWQSGMELFIMCKTQIRDLRRRQKMLPTAKRYAYEKTWLDLYGQRLILRAVVKKLARSFNRRSTKQTIYILKRGQQ